MEDLEGLGERTFGPALEVWPPSHAGSLETASANWTLSCQDTSDRATAPPSLSLVGVGRSAEAGVSAAGSWGLCDSGAREPASSPAD